MQFTVPVTVEHRFDVETTVTWNSIFVTLLRKDFQVSAEAVLIRLVKLASSRVAYFSTTRLPKRDHTAEYRINYRIGSSHWSERATRRMRRRVRSDVLDECVAIGSTSKGTETWEPGGPEVHVEAVALPPLPGTENLRIAGFMRPASERPDVGGIEYRQGNAAVFAAERPTRFVPIHNMQYPAVAELPRWMLTLKQNRCANK